MFQTADGQTDAASLPLNLTVEMETGTGKTYVYLRTIYELHRTYGFRKFVIVVPSVAIREGVCKTFKPKGQTEKAWGQAQRAAGLPPGVALPQKPQACTSRPLMTMSSASFCQSTVALAKRFTRL